MECQVRWWWWCHCWSLDWREIETSVTVPQCTDHHCTVSHCKSLYTPDLCHTITLTLRQKITTRRDGGGRSSYPQLCSIRSITGERFPSHKTVSRRGYERSEDSRELKFWRRSRVVVGLTMRKLALIQEIKFSNCYQIILEFLSNKNSPPNSFSFSKLLLK